ncbi:hypothetical protein [Chitinophaga barathri]|nr:hypothetical protein [Chitinophaga barathri]
MNQHNGMRPQDIAVLIKIAVSQESLMNKDLATALHLSPAEIGYSLQRSAYARLIDLSKRKVMRNTFLEFIEYGLPVVFPAIKGPLAIGVPTAYSAPVMASYLMNNSSQEQIVWAHPDGTARGETISPLYPNAIVAALNDPELHNLLALVDVMRLGKVREKKIAIKLLSQKFDIGHA